MEINGLANIKILVDMAVMDNTESHTTIDVEVADKILEQLQLLERYMLAYEDAAEDTVGEAAHLECYQEIKPPHWHEIKANPGKYPLLKEIMNGSSTRINKTEG